MDPQPKNVNNFMGKLVLIFVRDEFDGCKELRYTGRVVDILSQGVTVHPIPGDNEVIDHIPWSNILCIRHTSHLEADIILSEATCGAHIDGDPDGGS